MLPMEEVMKLHSHQSGETPSAYAYGCPLLQRNGGAVAARNLAAHCSQETPVQADTRRARNQERMVSRLSEETAGTGGSQKRKRGASVRGDHRARRARDQERAANRRAGERVVSLEVEVGQVISALSILGQTFWDVETVT